jgi:hypothetical protein
LCQGSQGKKRVAIYGIFGVLLTLGGAGMREILEILQPELPHEHI